MLINVSLGGVDTLIGKPLFDTKVLLDSGSSLNLISENLVDALQIPLVVKDKPFEIRLAEKFTVCQINAETKPIWLVIGSHKEKLVFNVFPSLSCPMIIGMPWLEFHNPEIDWTLRTLHFNHCRCNDSPLIPNSNFDLDCGAVIRFGVGFDEDEVFDDVGVTQDSSGLLDIYADFADVFSAQNADILPEHRKYDCEIILKSPDSIPPFRPAATGNTQSALRPCSVSLLRHTCGRLFRQMRTILGNTHTKLG